MEIYDEPGDVMMFPGSAVWHLRRNSANTVNLYLKCNDFDCDPLAEDPSTERRRLDTADLLARSGSRRAHHHHAGAVAAPGVGGAALGP